MDLVDGREVGQKILAKVAGREGLRRPRRIVSFVLGKVRMIKEPDVEPLLVHALEDQVFSEAVDPDCAIFARP